MSIKKSPYLILDRDGTIIEDKIYLSKTSQIVYLPNAIEALKNLKSKGFRFVIATNQSGVAIGRLSLEQLHAVHSKISEDLAIHDLVIDHFYYAPYAVETNHWMRKPNPGMLEAAIKDWSIDVSKSYMIGDRFTDVLAGNVVGIKTVFLGNKADIETDIKNHNVSPTHICKHLFEFSNQYSF